MLIVSFFNSSLFATDITCSASILTPVNFGNYNPFDVTPLDTTGTLVINCSAYTSGVLASYSISFNAGSYGSFAAREMANGNDRLNYNLYTDPAHTTLWGDGTSNTVIFPGSCLISFSNNCAVNFTIYALMPAEQNVAVGNYSDTITVTVLY
jgi:spore coat protein U-like protein